MFDAIVVGGGMGGGAIAFSLSEKGHKVLLVEKGFADAALKMGDGIEYDDSAEGRLSAGLHPTQIRMNLDGTQADIWPTVGCGLGGSTLHYAGTLERLDPRDFDGMGSNVGQSPKWPFGYGDLESKYQQVENLFNVCGTPDGLESNTNYNLLEPPAMSESDRCLFDSMGNAGLHPYRIHMAVKYESGCDECLRNYCSKACRSDAYNKFIEPALVSGNLCVMDLTHATSIEVDKDKAIGVRVSGRQGDQLLKARQIILATGALFTPVVLLNSKSEFWPSGLGNKYDQVGRNLMFHASDFIAVWPPRNKGKQGPARSIALRDFYFHNGVKLGEIQSMGITAGYGEILHYWRNKLGQSPFRAIPMLPKLLSIPALIGSQILKEATVFATVVEDFPYAHNRVVVDESSPSGMRFDYEISAELRERVLLMRKLTKKSFSGFRRMFLNTPVGLNFGHSCGTCRAGDDPTTSVVDKNCRVHGLENVYIADGSIFPSSGGTNPSLTIAANALRVADLIDIQLHQDVDKAI